MKTLCLLLSCLLGGILSNVLSTRVAQNFQDIESQKIEFLADLVTTNINDNGWKNIIIFGPFPNSLYIKLKKLPLTFSTSNVNEDDHYVEDAVPYPSNTILINSVDFGNFEESLLKIMSIPYWHPHAKIYLYHHSKETKENIARIFFIFWYYRAPNVILIQDDDVRETFLISQFSPYVHKDYEIGEKFGCWTAKKLGMPIYTFEEGFVCERNCDNVTINSKVRAANLGTCLGYIIHRISYDGGNVLNLDLFPDKGKNFHGFAFRGFTSEILPFMSITELPDGTYRMGARDGTIWLTMADLLNFTIDLTESQKFMKKPFNFEIQIQNIFAVAHRKGDLFVNPIYQFDVIVVELDYTFAYKDSGVCFMSHRAGFETILLDLNMMKKNSNVLIRFSLSFLCIWFAFCLYGGTETRRINMDFFGKNFMNSIRSVLLINLLHPPKRTSFRMFLTITIWSFFVINFSTQAAITSFFTAVKRGREVNTFDDIIDKGYRIEGISSPDVILPDTDERFRKINSKLSPIQNLFACAKQLSNDSHRFCLIDCSVGRYLQRNKLNRNGEQYLHIAEDRVHSHYLNFVFPKHSVISDNFSKYMMVFFEAGLITKWEDYRFNNIKEDARVNALGMNDINGVFQMNAIFIFITIIVFLIELIIANHQKILYLCMKLKCKKIKRVNF